MSAPSSLAPLILPETDWLARRLAHETRVRTWTDPHQARASRSEKHPIYDFLFNYYPFRPAWLRQWHPGPDVILLGPSADTYLGKPDYHRTTTPDGTSGVTLDPAAFPARRHDFLDWLDSLLANLTLRPPFFGCFGLHEWAMVYRQKPEEIRHHDYPLRFPPDELARIVEAQPLRCSHFDAFRFFTPPARPLNRVLLTREQSPAFEQRGCLHANMDLYKWAFKLAPYTPSELIADCFDLARSIRETDMRASPYDLRALGFTPIPIETPDGRALYEQKQRIHTATAEPLLARLRLLTTRLRTARTHASQSV